MLTENPLFIQTAVPNSRLNVTFVDWLNLQVYFSKWITVGGGLLSGHMLFKSYTLRLLYRIDYLLQLTTLDTFGMFAKLPIIFI